ncbi:MAG: hypothetical protein KIT29_01735 [Anaerolineales bacterium]|nr:hypothetical protein [Anaerolineales bacterium]
MSSPRERILVTLLREIAAEQGYRFTSFSQDWILRLERQGQARHVFGFNFEINSATALSLAGDKAAVAALLADQGVAHIEHRFFLNPSRAAYVPDHGHWPAILAYAEAQHYQLVAKPNDGTGGLGVTHVQTQAQLERAVQTIFQRGQSLSLSPFYPIDNEFRLVMLDAECQLAYSKQRPALHGDGHSHLRSLLAAALLSGQISQAQASEALEQHQGQLERVLAAGESLTISWKHNLGAGATPRPLAAGPQLAALTQLAQAAAQAINIRFASIDIVEVRGELRVLEVNSGIMMEHFARHRPENRAQAKAIYARAVEKMFAPH